MAHISQLLTQLKFLKHSGAPDMLEHQLREAEQNQLAYSELLTMLLTDEIDTRRNRRLQRLIFNANIRMQNTLESCDFSFNRSINATQIRELASCRFIDSAENVFFLGPTGTGKTHLAQAQALAHAACRKDLTAAFYSFNDYFRTLHAADITDTHEKVD
jgi:DNA replication protein DnaC